MFWSFWLCLSIFTFLPSSLAYHQSDYNVTIDIVHLEFYNRTYYSSLNVGRTWFNRTTRVVSGNCTQIKDVGRNFKVDVQVYKFMSNEYRFFPLTMTIDVCTEYAKNTFGMRDTVSKCSNVKICPTKKGHFFFTNCLVDFSQFPPYMPSGTYKVEFKLFHNRDMIAEVHVYASVHEKKFLEYF